ncbi:M61 family metallopeptidase [Anaeromyxobacter sp. Fw109-5]|uniref:M61 family metallopeptidase n=1 Tax=Anaeromyxobacter sp. (strain Fw109-5) TaxID=404589 RepID=UPI0000ED8A9A|nr:PDZ domain-containing protein [Anaeromyxobacter sp. Fw109-5]ABS27530.1 peptidase M61 domain protein [Anaeromyxobacter sp. Fw109-5]
MRYRLSLPEPHTHLFHVEAILERPGAAPVLALPVWTPGSYLVREFARHLEGVQAEDGQGRRLGIERLDKQRFRVSAGDAERVVVRYRVYANELTVRTCHLDGTHGFLNGAAVFLFAPGREGEPHVVEVSPPEGWAVSTALPGGPTTFTARDYDELADSPFEIGRHRLVTFAALGRPHEIAIWGRGNLDEARLAQDARRIVETLGGLMGGLPYERYLFILHLTEKRRGGLEHAASTTLNVGRMQFFPRDVYEETLGLFSHEFFHLWNVKRMRPAALVPFDYGQEQYTRLLWWFEGATSYYEGLALSRAGIVDAKKHLRNLGRALTQLERTPGAGKMSVEESSFLAWVKLYRPDENSVNSTVSYYLKGELVALALDLALRRAGSSLDALLRALYARHEGRGVPEDGVERAAAELLGEEAARRFFDRHVRGTDPVDLDLEVVGLRLRRRPAQAFDDKGGTPPKEGDERPAPGWLGVELAPGPKLQVAAVREGSPAHRAGLYAEDELVAEGGFRVDRAALWDRLCEKGPAGALRLTVFRRDELVEVEVPLAAWPEDTVWLEPLENAGAAQRAAFEAWSGARWPGVTRTP